MTKTYWLVAWLLIAELFLILVFVPGQWTERVIAKETALVERALGPNTVEWTQDKAEHWLRVTMIDSGVYRALYRTMIPSQAERDKSVGLEQLGSSIFPWVEDRLEALLNVIYQVFARIALLMVWAPYMLILLFPAIYDGWLNWKIKRTNFDYASPVLHRYGIRGVALVAQVLLITFFAPIAMNPLMIPLAMMICCVLVGLVLGNVQKRI